MESELEPTYLPFSGAQLTECLATAAQSAKSHASESEDAETGRVGIKYYTTSINNYSEYKKDPKLYRTIAKSKFPRQIEKDERFWTAATLMAFKYSESPGENWSNLLGRCFGPERPPVGNFESWREAVGNNPTLLLEAPMPSPRVYSYWLRERLHERQIIQYVFDAVPANPEARLEGFTHADAIIVNPSNGFSVVFESKVLSDISTEITFDCMRNQIARIIDVMLERPDPEGHALDALSRRQRDLTCFVLLTPKLFQRNPWSRLYGRVIREYQSDPQALSRDLPHRRDNLDAVSRRLGWLTWEDCKSVLPSACPWLPSESS